MSNLDNPTLIATFIALTAIAMIVQAIVLLATFLAVRKAIKAVHEDLDEMRATALPVIDSARDLIKSTGDTIERLTPVVDRLAPVVESTAKDLSYVAHEIRVQVAEVQASTREVLARVQLQTSRIDSMFTGVLDGVDRAGNFVTSAVKAPIRQVSAILATAKAVVETLRTPEPVGPSTRSAQNKDFFG